MAAVMLWIHCHVSPLSLHTCGMANIPTCVLLGITARMYFNALHTWSLILNLSHRALAVYNEHAYYVGICGLYMANTYMDVECHGCIAVS